MKTILLSLIIIGISINSHAQNDTSKVEQYCKLVAQGRLFSKKVTIDVDFGEERKLFGDTRMRDEITGKLQKFNSVTDAMNYMGSMGWTLVNAFPMTDGSGQVYHFYFKKSFSRAEVARRDD